jgi:hypothetical protein
MIADRAEQVAHIHSIRVLFLDLSVLVVQRKEQGLPKAKRIRVTQRVMTVHALNLANDFGLQLGDEIADLWRRLIYPASSVSLRRVFGSVDRFGADRTLDRAGAARV